MNARESILGNIRRRLEQEQDSAAVNTRLREHPSGPLPARGQGDPAALHERFIQRARLAEAEVIECAGAEEIPATVAGLRARDEPERPLPMDADPRLDGIDWAGAGLAVEHRPATADDELSVSVAACGIAETGTLLLCSGHGRPTRLAFLPETHVIVVEKHSIVGHYEEAWRIVREQGEMPRTVNWITGPSRSADIEQSLHLGAHGPVRLVVLIAPFEAGSPTASR